MEAPSWDIRRKGRKWTREEVMDRLYRAPRKIEFVGGVFSSSEERMDVLHMLLENLGIDQVVQLGKLKDWQAAIVAREKKENR